MAIRKKAVWVAKCSSQCGKKIEYIEGQRSNIPFYYKSDLIAEVKRQGWHIEKYDKVYCPSCYKKRQRAKAQVKKNRRRL